MKKLFFILCMLYTPALFAQDHIYREGLDAVEITHYTDTSGTPITGAYTKEIENETDESFFKATYILKEGLAHGAFTERTITAYDELIVKGTYFEGKKDGVITTENSEKDTSYTYVKGILHGEYFIQQGNRLTKGTYSSGLMEKEAFYYKGAIDAEFTYKNDLRHGVFYRYYPSGRIKVKGEYVEAKITGDVLLRWDDPQENYFIGTLQYENGEAVTVTCFSPAEPHPLTEFWQADYDVMTDSVLDICIDLFG